jgi:hypothetical protein
VFFKRSFSDPGILGWGVGGFAVWTAFFVARVHAAEDGAGGIVTV